MTCRYCEPKDDQHAHSCPTRAARAHGANSKSAPAYVEYDPAEETPDQVMKRLREKEWLSRPCEGLIYDEPQPSLTLRDHFAMAALSGTMSNMGAQTPATIAKMAADWGISPESPVALVAASAAYKMADAMMIARQK